MAGLCAAYELQQAGHDVTVLEARSRPGGRVLTLRTPFADGLYAEAGATFVPAAHEYTMHYVRLFQLPLEPIPYADDSTLYYLKGQRIRLDEPHLRWPVTLTAEEEAMGLTGLFEKYLMPAVEAVGDPAGGGWPPPAAASYDAISFAAFLRRQGASPGAVALMRLGYFDLLGEGIDAVSALSLLRDQTRSILESFLIPGGYDRLVSAFVAPLAGRIRYGHPVVALVQGEGVVQAVVARSRGREIFTADYLICTIPFSVLKRLAVEPPFSRSKAEAINELNYTSVTRIHLQCRNPFWQSGKGIVSVLADTAVKWCFGFPCTGANRRGILDLYLVGSQAREVAALDETERLRFATQEAARFFPDLRDNVEGGVSYCWDADEWSRGAYAWFRPGQLLRLQPAIEAPEGRIHFAGDHASPWPGWVQGALYSGLRAAREVQTAPA
jgi:monoamine oxidase